MYTWWLWGTCKRWHLLSHSGDQYSVSGHRYLSKEHCIVILFLFLIIYLLWCGTNHRSRVSCFHLCAPDIELSLSAWSHTHLANCHLPTSNFVFLSYPWMSYFLSMTTRNSAWIILLHFFAGISKMLGTHIHFNETLLQSQSHSSTKPTHRFVHLEPAWIMNCEHHLQPSLFLSI